uniref:Uncharacterized protein n=1 Tax=Siphoviridae sp. ct96x5 TaxID=2825367 RepID=A0A8S5PS21_9CAUD|nr:MAG TPA: hypothetical protein [Siphoviridae sp. ct96x5]
MLIYHHALLREDSDLFMLSVSALVVGCFHQ